MKLAKRISFWISWGAVLNLGINLLLATVIKIEVDLHKLGPGFEIVGATMVVYSIILLAAAVAISNKINYEIRRRRNANDRKEKVTINMQAVSSNDIVGGLYGAFTALSQDVPEGTVALDNMWTTRPASRTSHQYSSNGGSGTFRARTWLDGSGETGQSWTMKVNKTNRNYLMLLYWGDESDTRNFNIMCDDVLVAQESLLHNDPGRFMMRCYPIPEEGTSGKETVRIHLTSPTGTKTGGIFYAYMLSAKDDETSIIAPSAFHQNDSIYDLSGRKVANSPISYSLPKGGLSGALRKGLYVHNGIKIAIK